MNQNPTQNTNTNEAVTPQEAPVYDKLVLAILQGEDYHNVVRELNANGFYVTILHSSGGFLKRRSATIMIGLNSSRLEDALRLLKKDAGERTETVYQPMIMNGPAYASASAVSPIPIPVHCGGVTVFVLDITRSERF